MIFQSVISVLAVGLDRKSWFWLLGMRDEPPAYVITAHKKQK
ncbi:MAG: hypothetical protein ACW99A_09215 [Candidatus Kariarchaeaceae archaeon]